MAEPTTARAARRIVVKVGSSSLTTAGGGIDPERVERVIDAVAAARQRGTEVVLVSSGAIAAGLAPLRMASRPRDLARQQAAASVGQGLLVHRYTAGFERHGLQVGQVLLTVDDMTRRAHHRNAQRTLVTLLEMGAVPIVNENDTVATHEIRFGDNDRLAALVAHLVHADALVLLSDVDGLYTTDPRRPGARRLDEVHQIDELSGIRLRGGGSGVGTGGMATKIEAATIATSSGIPVLLAAASAVGDAMAGRGGTAFHPTADRTASRLFWLRHATTPRGQLVLDDGAVAAVVTRRTSLLPAGITKVIGEFESGDPVELVDAAGVAVGRGLVSYDSADLPALLGRKTRDLPAEFRREVVHRDDLVLL